MLLSLLSREASKCSLCFKGQILQCDVNNRCFFLIWTWWKRTITVSPVHVSAVKIDKPNKQISRKKRQVKQDLICLYIIDLICIYISKDPEKMAAKARFICLYIIDLICIYISRDPEKMAGKARFDLFIYHRFNLHVYKQRSRKNVRKRKT